MEKLNLLKVQKLLKEKGISIFTPLDFQRIFEVSFYSTKNFINRHISTGLFIKVRNGLYVFRENIPPKFVLANKLYQPSYISFESALSYYHIIPETIYSVFSATSKSSREFEALQTSFIYHRIKKKLFFGYVAKKMNGATCLIAEPEKALVDFLYFVDLRKKDLFERIDLKEIKKKDVVKIARFFKRDSLINLIDKIYDKPKNY